MKRLARLTLIFSVIFGVLIISPALFNQQFDSYPLMKMGDIIDLFTPLILIPLYWLLFQVSREKTPSLNETTVFLILAALWVMGQGMHLSANSIGHLLGELQDRDVYQLAHFYDEVLSHYLWHFGLVGLSVVLLYRQWQHPFVGERTNLWLEGLAGLIYGLVYFIAIIEADTTPLGVPFAILVTIFSLVWGREKLKQQPLLAFFSMAYLVATVFFVGWAIYWGGFPEFSEVGIID